MHKLWLSLLARPGTLLPPKFDGNSIKHAIFVLTTSISGVLGVPVSLGKLNGVFFARLELEAGGGASLFWRQKLIVDENAWVTIPVNPLPLCVAAHAMGRVGFSIYLELPSLTCTPSSHTYASRQAFKGMVVPMMQKLVGHFKLGFERGGKPTREWDVTQTLVKHVLPNAAPGEVEAIMAKRDACPTPVYTTYLTTKALDACRDAMDADEFGTAVHQLERGSKNISRGQAKAQPKQEASAKPPARAATALRPDPGQTYAQDDAKAVLPVAKRCTITKDINLHMRWEVYYPSTSSPFSMSCAFGSSQHEALLACLRWVGEQHVAHGGSACPWQ